MKIKLPIDLLIIDILSALLILSIVFIPGTAARIVLGLPFLLFFPGYILVAALFPRDEMDSIERIALSFGMSIAVVALIGLGLNYTSWGIRLEPVLYSIFIFIAIISAVAIMRRRSYGRKELTSVINVEISRIFQGSTLNKTLNVILIVVILGAVGTLIYTIAKPKVGEKFTEFYILGINGQAADYPTDFTLNSNNEVVSVQYGIDTLAVKEKWGRLTLGIVNHEQQDTSYTIVMQIDGTVVNMPFQDGSVQNLGPIILVPEEKWRQEIGIVPQHTGDSQQVELLLYKNNETEPYLNLHLWVNVKK